MGCWYRSCQSRMTVWLHTHRMRHTWREKMRQRQRHSETETAAEKARHRLRDTTKDENAAKYNRDKNRKESRAYRHTLIRARAQPSRETDTACWILRVLALSRQPAYRNNQKQNPQYLISNEWQWTTNNNTDINNKRGRQRHSHSDKPYQGWFVCASILPSSFQNDRENTAATLHNTKQHQQMKQKCTKNKWTNETHNTHTPNNEPPPANRCVPSQSRILPSLNMIQIVKTQKLGENERKTRKILLPAGHNHFANDNISGETLNTQQQQPNVPIAEWRFVSTDYRCYCGCGKHNTEENICTGKRSEGLARGSREKRNRNGASVLLTSDMVINHPNLRAVNNTPRIHRWSSVEKSKRFQ